MCVSGWFPDIGAVLIQETEKMDELLGGSGIIEGRDGGGSWAPEHAFERCT